MIRHNGVSTENSLVAVLAQEFSLGFPSTIGFCAMTLVSLQLEVGTAECYCTPSGSELVAVILGSTTHLRSKALRGTGAMVASFAATVRAATWLRMCMVRRFMLKQLLAKLGQQAERAKQEKTTASIRHWSRR